MRIIQSRLHKVNGKNPSPFGDADLRRLLEGETEELFTITFDESFPGRVVHQGFARYDVTEILERYDDESRRISKLPAKKGWVDGDFYYFYMDWIHMFDCLDVSPPFAKCRCSLTKDVQGCDTSWGCDINGNPGIEKKGIRQMVRFLEQLLDRRGTDKELFRAL